MPRLAAAAALVAWLAAAPAASAQPVTVAQSARLGIEVQAPDAEWCTAQPDLRVIVADAGVFASPAFAALVARLGLGLVAGCPQARAILLTGQVRGETAEAAWHGMAEAASGWAVRPVAPAAAPAAGPEATAPETSAGPSMAPAGPPVRLDAAGLARAVVALGSVPGRIDARHGCWATAARGANGAASGCLRIVRGFNAAGPNGNQVFLLLSGKGTADCHACAGLIAFAILDAAGPDWRLTVPPVPVDDGVYGQPTEPANFAFVRLGRDRWGWIENNGDIAQGIVESVHTIHLLRGTAFAKAGLLPGARDNGGACGDPGDPITSPSCATIENIDVAAVPDASNPDAAAYPILLHATGSVFQAGKGKRRIDKRAVARFDEARFEYVAPPAWP